MPRNKGYFSIGGLATSLIASLMVAVVLLVGRPDTATAAAFTCQAVGNMTCCDCTTFGGICDPIDRHAKRECGIGYCNGMCSFIVDDS